MEGVRSGIQAGSNMRSNFTDLSDLPFSHFPPPNTNPISPLKTHNRYDDFDIKSFTRKEEQEEGSGGNFGAILRKSCLAPITASLSFRYVDSKSNVQSGEEGFLNEEAPLNWRRIPPDSYMGRESKKRGTKIVRACKRLLRFS